MIELIKSPRSLAFVQYMKKVLGKDFYNPSYSNLLGFTIKGNYLQFKNYYELRSIPTDEVLAEFLPQPWDFRYWVGLWDSEIKSSLALALKLDSENETKYFHVKFGDNEETNPKLPFIKLLQNQHPRGGISVEYTNGKVATKNYLYIENKEDIAKVLALNKVVVDPNELEHLECYYTDDNDFKFNLIYHRPQPTPNICKLDDETKKTYAEVVNFLDEQKKPIWYVGMTKSGKLSVYFTATDDKDFIERL